MSAPTTALTKPSLGRRAISGSLWTLGQYAFSTFLRLVSNLVLTRLLMPEMFGLMALVNLFVGGLQMLSDVGLGPNIIQSRRGDEAAFLNTAWTIQIIRGCALWGGTCVLAWPLAVLYGLPELSWVIPVVGLTALINGFHSMALFTHTRHLSLARPILLEVGTQAVALVATVLLAALFRSVWALVACSLIGALLKVTLSHVVLHGPPHRFAWEREAVTALARFGRWIFLATLLTYFSAHADRLVLGYFMTASEFGVYSVAFVLSQALTTAIGSLADKVILPLYSRLGERDQTQLPSKVLRFRRVLLAAGLPLVCVLAIAAPALVGLLYDNRYQAAGWMLRLLAVGSIIPVLTAPLTPLVLARGAARRHAVLMTVRLVLTLNAMLAGGWLAGTAGLLIGYAFTPVLFYPVQVALVFRPYGVWTPVLDGVLFGASLGAIALGAWAFG